jgi:hypothetical protein
MGLLRMPMMTVQIQSLLEQSDALYERYGKPLEKTHQGKFIAISIATGLIPRSLLRLER